MRRLLITVLILLLAATPAWAGFGGFLKADTQVIVTVGPFVDATDGVTPETGVTLAAADEAELIKHGSTSVVDISGATWAAVTNMDGYYSLTLTTSHTDTEGIIEIAVNDDSVCLPVNKTYFVVNANIFDSFFAAAATDYLQVDLLQMGGAAQSATDLKDFADAGYDPANDRVVKVYQLTELDEDNTTIDLDGSTIGTCTTNTDMVSEPPTATAIVDEWETQSQADPTGFHVNVKEVNGTAQTANDNGADINDILTDTAAYDTDAEYATAIWNAATASYGGAGTYGQAVEDALADTNELQGAQNWDVWDDGTRTLTAIDEDSTTLDFDATAVGDVTAAINCDQIEGGDATDAINAAVDAALDTAIPGSPTANSINERVKAIDDKLPSNYIMGSSVATDKDDEIDAIKLFTDRAPF